MPVLRTPWRAVAAAFALNGVLLGAWAARVPAVVVRHGLSDLDLGLLLLAMGVGALASFALAGRLADGLGAIRVTRWFAGAYLCALILVGIAPNVVVLAGGLCLFGMGHGSMDVTMNSWATEVERHMGRPVMSSFHAMWSLGAGAGAATGFVATSMGVPVALHFALVAVGAAALLAPFLWIPWVSRTRRSARRGPIFALPRGALVLVGLIALSAGLGEGAMTDWSAVFLHEVVGTSEARATLGFAVYSVTMVATRLCVDRLVMRFGPARVTRASGLMALIGVGLVVGPVSLPAALAGFVAMGMGYAGLFPLAFSRAAADPDIPPGQGIASVATLGYGAMLLGPPLIGLISDLSSLRVALCLLGGAAVLVAVLAPVLDRKPLPLHRDNGLS